MAKGKEEKKGKVSIADHMSNRKRVPLGGGLPLFLKRGSFRVFLQKGTSLQNGVDRINAESEEIEKAIENGRERKQAFLRAKQEHEDMAFRASIDGDSDLEEEANNKASEYAKKAADTDATLEGNIKMREAVGPKLDRAIGDLGKFLFEEIVVDADGDSPMDDPYALETEVVLEINDLVGKAMSKQGKSRR